MLGRVSFRTRQGLLGTNVVARPRVPGMDIPDIYYPAAAVTESLFMGDAGNLITGTVDSPGQPLNGFGTGAATDEGWCSLSEFRLPPGRNSGGLSTYLGGQ